MYLRHQISSIHPSSLILPFGMSWVQVQGSTFRGVADTGSPFLLVAACVGARRAAGRCSEAWHDLQGFNFPYLIDPHWHFMLYYSHGMPWMHKVQCHHIS